MNSSRVIILRWFRVTFVISFLSLYLTSKIEHAIYIYCGFFLSKLHSPL